ncbi:MAG: hypothetical protein UIM53_04320 [Acutalibacteraceae bacterium]|nr:hypothetical protein [Acutalibacteraceae bacterium]
MKNPFFVTSSNGYNQIDNNCSINKITIAKTPLKGIDDNIEGKMVSEIFSTPVITEKIRENAHILKIPSDTPNENLPHLLLDLMESTDEQVRSCVNNIATFFGKRLGLIFLTLKTALPENKKARPDWNDKHWEYWQNIKNIITVGGLTNGNFGKIIIDEAQKLCTFGNNLAYKITVFDNSSHIGIMGCAKLLENSDGINILLDLGQTNMKRGIVTRKDREIVNIKNLPSIPSKYMKWIVNDNGEKEKQARLLHRYIVRVITDTYKEASYLGNVENEIVISIANYTHDGVLDDIRGGYAKLAVLYKNYSDYLSEELSGILKTSIKVKLIHDGTAVSLNFSDYPQSVCVTLGTFLGVGFTDIF